MCACARVYLINSYMYAYYDHDLHILHVSMMLCRKCIGQGKGPIKHMDTQSTMPWTGADTQDSPAGVPSLVLADLLELGKDDLGRALFFQSLRLGPGASAFPEFVLNGLKMMMEDDGNDPKRFAKLQHVHNMTAQLIKDATEKTGARDHFVAEGYEKVLTSAQMSVVKVKAMADRDADKAKAEAQKQKADVWLSREVAALDKRKADLSLAATKAASFAAGKVHALINHLRSMGLLSRYFVEQMELWSQLQVAEGDEDGFVEESLAVEPQPERPENHNFMPRALQVPGACHAIHNACLNLDDALSEFDWFFTSLKKLDALIGNKRRRERFVQVVLTGTPLYEAGQKVLESFSSTLHKERWGELAGYLSDGLPILIFHRQHWDPVAYSRGLQEDAVEGDEFSCRGITELLKDEYFCAYWHVQLQLRDVVRSLLRWVEGCSCHSNLLSGVPPHRQQTQLRREISCPREVACRCPVMGCRAADMAAGQLLHFAESVFSLRFADFASALQNPLSVDAWGRLRQEWSKAAAFVCENLKIRSGFHQSLPWIILGGTHADPAKARKCLQEAQSLWHDLPEFCSHLQFRRIMKAP